jgi:hypothetical protein
MDGAALKINNHESKQKKHTVTKQAPVMHKVMLNRKPLGYVHCVIN